MSVDHPRGHDVRLVEVAARSTAVIKAITTWQEFPHVWTGMLDEVWACLRAQGVRSGCPNVMLYLDDVPNVEIGVLLNQPFPLTGRVTASEVPAGQAAVTVHQGSYAGLAGAHQAVLAWCKERELALSGTRWEVYGPQHQDQTRVWTEVYWLLAR